MADAQSGKVRLRYNREVPHKIGAHKGGPDSKATVPIILRHGVNVVDAAAWAAAKKLKATQHHLTAKSVPAERDGKRVLVPLIEELEAEAGAPATAGGDAAQAATGAAAAAEDKGGGKGGGGKPR